MSMKKKIFAALAVAALTVAGCGYFVGSYFTEYALKRSDDGPPIAAEHITDKSLAQPPLPASQSKIEEWTIYSDDGLKLCATCFYPLPENAAKNPRRTWAILIHGYGRDQSFAWDYAEEYLKRGFVVLTPDLRAAGKSEGEYLTMGEKESDDIVLWAKAIAKREPDADIVLHGVSMGAATAIMASSKDLPPNAIAVVEDCGYTSAYEMFGGQLEKIFNLPRFPIMNCIDIVCKLKTGTALSSPTPLVESAATKIPALFIHGDADKLVPYQMMQELFDASGAPKKEMFTVPGAGHADAKKTDPQAYWQKIFEFIDHARQ